MNRISLLSYLFLVTCLLITNQNWSSQPPPSPEEVLKEEVGPFMKDFEETLKTNPKGLIKLFGSWQKKSTELKKKYAKNEDIIQEINQINELFKGFQNALEGKAITPFIQKMLKDQREETPNFDQEFKTLLAESKDTGKSFSERDHALSRASKVAWMNVVFDKGLREQLLTIQLSIYEAWIPELKKENNYARLSILQDDLNKTLKGITAFPTSKTLVSKAQKQLADVTAALGSYNLEQALDNLRQSLWALQNTLEAKTARGQ